MKWRFLRTSLFRIILEKTSYPAAREFGLVPATINISHKSFYTFYLFLSRFHINHYFSLQFTLSGYTSTAKTDISAVIIVLKLKSKCYTFIAKYKHLLCLTNESLKLKTDKCRRYRYKFVISPALLRPLFSLCVAMWLLL